MTCRVSRNKQHVSHGPNSLSGNSICIYIYIYFINIYIYIYLKTLGL